VPKHHIYMHSLRVCSCKPLLYTCAVLDAFKMGSQLVLLYIVLALVDATEDEAAGTKLASDVLTVRMCISYSPDRLD
jgi:hypothetical protein